MLTFFLKNAASCLIIWKNTMLEMFNILFCCKFRDPYLEIDNQQFRYIYSAFKFTDNISMLLVNLKAEYRYLYSEELIAKDWITLEPFFGRNCMDVSNGKVEYHIFQCQIPIGN